MKNKKGEMRLELQAIRRMTGNRSLHKTDTTMLNDKELYAALDSELEALKGN